MLVFFHIAEQHILCAYPQTRFCIDHRRDFPELIGFNAFKFSCTLIIEKQSLIGAQPQISIFVTARRINDFPVVFRQSQHRHHLGRILYNLHNKRLTQRISLDAVSIKRHHRTFIVHLARH